MNEFIFSSIKLYREIYFKESLLQNFVTSFLFCFLFFFAYLLLYVPLDEQIPFYRKQFSPSFNKNGKLQLPTWSLP